MNQLLDAEAFEGEPQTASLRALSRLRRVPPTTQAKTNSNTPLLEAIGPNPTALGTPSHSLPLLRHPYRSSRSSVGSPNRSLGINP